MRLGVNIDHIATVRQARGDAEPDPVEAALVAERSGATSIVCHLREDRRHIQDRDVRVLRQVVHELFCLELSPTHEMLKIALEVRPNSVTLVPERREELTTEGGLDLAAQLGQVGEVVRALDESEIRSCVFIDPDLDQVKAANRVGARAVEIHTGRYADGLGNIKDVPDRIDFDPYPWHSMAIWILTQMKRWKHVDSEFDYAKVAQEVFMASECAEVSKSLGYSTYDTTMRKHVLMGGTFDPAEPEAYVKSFPINNLG